MTRRRRATGPESLTSLLDVLFILVFASLVQVAAANDERQAAGPEAPEVGAAAVPAVPGPNDDAGVAVMPDAGGPVAPEILRQRAIRDLAQALEGRVAVVARIGGDGSLRLLEHDGESTSLGVPLLERVPDVDVALAYLGDRSSELQVCRIVALRLGLGDLRQHLVVIAPDAPLAQLSVALVAGLRRDAERCLSQQQGVAVVVDSSTALAPAEAP